MITTTIRALKETVFIFLIIISLHGQASSRVIEKQSGITKLTHPPNTIPNAQPDGQTDGQTYGQTDQKQLKNGGLDKDIKTDQDDIQMSELSIDQVIALASRYDTSQATGRPLWQRRQELDIWLTKEQSDLIYGTNTGRHRRKAHRDLTRRWTDNKIIYRRQPNAFNSRQWSMITSAMQEFERLTCLTFHEDTDHSHTNYLDMDSEGGYCGSYVGMVGGRQELTLGSGCFVSRVVLHEIGHAIGFFHEHQRPDRDAYIKVTNRGYQFMKLASNRVNLYNVPYDFTSIMHYGPYTFSYNNKPNIRSIDPRYQGIFGKSSHLSFYDVMLANRMYQCDAGCDPTVRCPHLAYKGKDCKCYCKSYDSTYSPEMLCSSRTTRATSSTSSTSFPYPCKDLSASCRVWVASSRYLCSSHPSVRKLCSESCDLCRFVTTAFVSPTTSEIPRTTDGHNTTPETTTKSSEKTPKFPETTPKSPGKTTTKSYPFINFSKTTKSPDKTTTPTTPRTTTGCHDDLMSCSTLADPRLDYCATNDNVRKRCKKSCGLCDGDRSTAGVTVTTLRSTTTTAGRTTEGRTTRRNTPLTTGRHEACRDGSRACSHWARAGVCHTDINVQKLCPKSCDRCSL